MSFSTKKGRIIRLGQDHHLTMVCVNTSTSVSTLVACSTSISPSVSTMRMEEDVHPNMRVCMVGDAQVGKTSLVSQFVTSEHMKDFDASLGMYLLC